MLNRFRSSPRTILIVFVIVVNILASLITSLFWIFFSDSIPAADIKPFGGLIPLGIVIIIAAVISTPLSKKAAKPTLDMIQATHAIADGDYSVRVDEEGNGQVHELLHSFNLMTAELNSTENRAAVTALVSDRFVQIPGSFDVILTNPPIRAGKEIIYGMYQGAFEHLTPGGLFLAVVRRKQGAETSARKIEEIFGACEVIARDKGYWILKGIK